MFQNIKIKIQINTYTKTERIIFKAINITLIVGFFALFLLYLILGGKYEAAEINWLAILIICLFVVWALLNFTTLGVESLNKRKIEKNLRNFQNQNDYVGAIEYLKSISDKKYFLMLSQRLIHYMGYFSLMTNSIEEGMEYLNEYKIEKQYPSNLDCTVLNILLSYLIPFINGNEDEVKIGLDKYLLNKNKIIKSRQQPGMRFITNIVFETIDLLEKDDKKSAIERIKDYQFSSIPLIAKFIKENE